MKKIISILLLPIVLILLVVPCSALDTDIMLLPKTLSVCYAPTDSQRFQTIYEKYYFSGNTSSAFQPYKYEEGSTTDISHYINRVEFNFNVMGAPSGYMELQRGYIYTISGSFAVTKRNTSFPNTSVDFFMSNANITDGAEITGAVVYFTESMRGSQTLVDFQVIVEITEDFDTTFYSSNNFYFPTIGYDARYDGGDVVVRNINVTKSDSYGEEGFQQANIQALEDLKSATEDQTLKINEAGKNIVESNNAVKDAIDNMWQNEYNFVTDMLPSTDESEEEVNGVLDELDNAKNSLQILYEACTTDDTNPCILLPRIYVPIMDIEIYEGGYFYPIDYLLQMHNGFEQPFKIIKAVCNGVSFIGFVFFLIKQFNFREWVK